MRVAMLVLAMFFFLSAHALAGPEIYINIPEYKLSLIDNGQLVKTYKIAVGTIYEQTPTGTFRVFYKEKNPTWFPGSGFIDKTPVPPGPDNPLGTRWIEFQPAYGIHGTNKDWSIEYPVSGGCIRMMDMAAQELYEIVDIGTPVIITYRTLVLIEKPDGLYLRIYADIYNKNTTTEEQFRLLLEPYLKRYPVITEPKWPITVAFPDIFEQKIASMPTAKPKGSK